MYTEQMTQLLGLMGVDISTAQGKNQLLQTFIATMGNCAQSIEHRGQVVFTGDLSDAPETCPDQIRVEDGRILGDEMPALVKFIGRGQRNTTTGCVKGGYSLACFGPAYFEDAYVGKPVKFGVAITNWSREVNGVDVYACEDIDGSNPTTQIDRVYFPNDIDRAPNVLYGQVIRYTTATDGTYHTPDGMSQAIGTELRAWIDQDFVPDDGWGLMNGASNGSGTGYNIIDMFELPTDQAGEIGKAGGNYTHSHDAFAIAATTGVTAVGALAAASAVALFTGYVTAAAIVATLENHTCQQVVDCIADHSAAEIVACVDDHPAQDIADALQSHLAQGALSNVLSIDDTGDGTDVVTPFSEQLDHEPGDDVAHAGTQEVVEHQAEQGNGLEHAAVAAATASVVFEAVAGASAAVAVAITDLGHEHPVLVAEESNYPPYRKLFVYERLDNSHEAFVAAGGTPSNDPEYPISYSYA